MGKYLALWEVDQTKIPVDPKQKGAGWGMLMAMVRKDFEKEILKSWGGFIGETTGYAIWEGKDLEVMNAITQYVPFVIFKLHPIATEDQVNEMIKTLMG